MLINKIETNSIEASFLDDLLNGIEKNKKSLNTKSKPAYSPSSLRCQRQNYFKFIGIEKDKQDKQDYTLIGMGEIGIDRHLRLQNYLKINKKIEYIDIQDYIKEKQLDYLKIIGNFGNETLLFDSRYNIRFMADGIVKYKEQLFLLEIKTETSFKFDSHSEVHSEHYNQAIAYSIAFNLTQVLFLYENRDLLYKKVFILSITPDMKNNLLRFISEVDNAVKNSELPPKPKEASGTFCQYCEYKKTCRGITV